MTSRPTIVDVAARSGVSKSTVSNVIRGGPHVSAEVQQRVLDAVRELGYRPNGLARQLVLQRTSTIGVVVGDLANPFYGELVKLLERYANELGYSTIASNTDGHPEREAARIEALLEQRVSGIAMLQFSGNAELLDELLADGVALALVGSTDERVDCAGVDETLGLALAVRHLASLGHRRIAYVTSRLVDERTDAARHASFARACRATRSPCWSTSRSRKRRPLAPSSRANWKTSHTHTLMSCLQRSRAFVPHSNGPVRPTRSQLAEDAR